MHMPACWPGKNLHPGQGDNCCNADSRSESAPPLITVYDSLIGYVSNCAFTLTRNHTASESA